MTTRDALNDAALNGWLITPASNLVVFLADEMSIAGVTERALLSMSGMPTLLSAARHQLPKDDAEAQQRMQWLIDFTRNDAEFAEAEIGDDMRRVRSHHAVATWAAVETTIEHTLVNHIRRVPDAVKLILAHTPAVKPRSIRTITTRGAKSTIKAWESELSQTETMERQLEMLRAFSLNITLEGDNSCAVRDGGLARRDPPQCRPYRSEVP